ncbi:hypothetical protein HNP46_000059 [Pseudomonas nitritireducens]|uniref:DUF3841 domain-containing protein n=1 Tax=Pseudomonas nitroreducens TaxID=46680 RepID=A0A7W7NY19_PSENT|nr:DUF3841 domain-containing protein [Pseudomonas nitritireducens]MBB4861248.1 hypothetical protein [Pseudomonas nitritireducens]
MHVTAVQRQAGVRHFIRKDGTVPAWMAVDKRVLLALSTTSNSTVPAHLADEHVGHVYPWMISQMESSGLARPEGANTPWWCWLQYNSFFCRPPADSSNQVLLELSLPAHIVLASCFDDWHMVINNSPITSSEREWSALCYRLAKAGFPGAIPEKLPPEQQSWVEEKWPTIFDLQWHGDVDWSPQVPILDRCVQGVFWSMQPEYIVAVRDFGILDDDEALDPLS